MVEVVTSEEFIELRKSIEERLDAIEKKLDDFINAVNEKQTQIKTNVEELNERIDGLAESSKSFLDRLRDALRPRATETPQTRTGSNPTGNTGKTIGKVAEVILRCPNFFNWDWCQDNCPMYTLCDEISIVQDVSKLPQKDAMGRFKGLLYRLEHSFRSKREEHA